MEANVTEGKEPILKEAWMRHAELDANAGALKKRYINLRRWVMVLGIAATFLAIFTAEFTNFDVRIEAILKILLIATPLVASMIAAFTSREMGDGRWLAMRAGGEEITKDIYIYRTVLANTPTRNRWLSNRLAVIMRQVYKSSSNKLDTEPFKGDIPVHYYRDDPNSDAGFKDLTPDEYIRYRLLNQLSWHEKKLVSIGRDKRLLTIGILGMGAMGALLAGIGEPFAVWVALTASITAALTGWEELQNREATIANYSKVKLELTILKDHWYGLRQDEQTDSEFFKLVLATENLLWMQNAEYIRSMQEALSSFEDEDARLVEDVVRESESMHKNLQESLYSETASVLAHTNEQLTAVIEDAGATVEGMVTTVSSEAIAYSDTAESAVDTAVDESKAVRTHIEATVTTEVEAWGDSAEEAVDSIAAESTQIRESAETAVDDEVEGWSDSAETVIESVTTESAEIRASAETTVTSEVEAWSDSADEAIAGAAAASTAVRASADEAVAAETEAWQESAQDAIDTAVTESEAMRDAADAAVDSAAATAATVRETASAEVDAWQDSAEDAIDTAAKTSAAGRIKTSNEVDAWQDTAEDVIDAAAEQSAGMREVAEHAADTAVDQSEAWQASASEAVDAAAAESDAWRESAEDAVDTAVDAAAAALGSVKYALEFEPILEDAAEQLADFQENFEEVIYKATPDVKYPISFDLLDDTDADNGENQPKKDEAADDAVNKAVDRILEEGVNVADDAIKEALAKASQDDD